VLIVDDDRSSRDLMAAALGQIGYRAVSAAQGERALAIARDAVPAAVVLDLLMPEMDGFQFLERFRRLPECRRVPVIIWSGKDLTEDDRSRLRASAQGVITKGRVSTSGLIEELRAFLPAAPA
jgi:CheY-like chemotaxis protein